MGVLMVFCMYHPAYRNVSLRGWIFDGSVGWL